MVLPFNKAARIVTSAAQTTATKVVTNVPE
jgi:hypothetical protein